MTAIIISLIALGLSGFSVLTTLKNRKETKKHSEILKDSEK